MDSSYQESDSHLKKAIKKDFLSRALALKTNNDLQRSGSIHNGINAFDSLNLSKKLAEDSVFDNSSTDKELVWIEWTKPNAVHSHNKVGWKEMHSVYFHPNAKALDKKITLWFLERTQDTISGVGRERTFFLSQFDEAKIYDLDVKFQKNFKTPENASVSIRIQYIRNEEELLKKIIKLYDQKRSLLAMLLKKWMDEVKSYQGRKSTKHRKKNSQFGGWYDQTLNIRPDPDRSLMSLDHTSRDQSLLYESINNDSGVVRNIGNDESYEFKRSFDSPETWKMTSFRSSINKERKVSEIKTNDEFFTLFPSTATEEHENQ